MHIEKGLNQVKIRIVKIITNGSEDFFIIDETEKPFLIGRADSLSSVIKSIVERLGVELIIEPFPGDYLFKLLSDRKDSNNVNA